MCLSLSRCKLYRKHVALKKSDVTKAKVTTRKELDAAGFRSNAGVQFSMHKSGDCIVLCPRPQPP